VTVYGEDVLYRPVRWLGAEIRAGRLSPVRLAESYLQRLEMLGPGLGAVATLMPEQALTAARRAEAELRAGHCRGPLHGVPYGAKDLFATPGVPTGWGAAPYRGQMLEDEATVIRRLREAGAVLVAKLAMVELAGGFGYDEADAAYTGPARTPWNRSYWAGGSSSGSGAAVAAALVPFALGTETWGSIVTPAAFCGVTGLRPTYGRVSRHGAMALSWTMDKVGVLSRTADDAGLVLAAIAGPDPLDASAVPRGYRYPLAPAQPIQPARCRIGVLRGATEGAQPAVRDNFEAALEVLAGSATLVRDVELPDYPYSAAAGLIIDAEGASAFEDLLADGRAAQLRAPGSRTGGYPGAVVLAKDYLRAMRMRRPLQRALDALLAEYDALAAPSRGTVAYPVDLPFRDAYPEYRGGTAVGAAGNLAGLPAIAVPTGFGEHGLPTSLGLTARAFEENRLFALANRYQQATDWHARRPPAS
jgi:aspartyl-tRNA(Asn)/glutamyl-tRNA(Gln) amidotransferase subunit A